MNRNFLIGIVLLAAFALQGVNLAPLLDQKDVFETPASSLQKQYPKLKWTDRSHRELHAVGKNAAGLTYKIYPLAEVRIAVTEGKVSGISLSLYNRGDSGEMERKPFRDLCDKLLAGLEKDLGRPNRNNSTLGSSVKLQSFSWNKGKNLLALHCGTGKNGSPEFIALELLPANGKSLSLRQNMRAKGNTSLAERVQTDENGAKYLDIPMVDQGDKGYCVPASVERVLKYYGSSLNQHAIARLLGSDGKKGTDIQSTVDKLSRTAGRLALRYREEYRFREFEPRRILAFYNRYNREAKKAGAAPIRQKTGSPDQPPAFELEPFCALRAKSSDQNKAWAAVTRNIDRGVPVFWVILLFPEPGKSGAVKGHMRLINGYKSDTKEVIYTDSWGEGHEKKSMPWREAWGITMRMFVLLPGSAAR